MWFKNFRIRSKLITLIATMLVCMIGLGVYALVELTLVNDSYTKMGKYYTKPMVNIQSILADVRMMRVNSLKICLMVGDQDGVQALINEDTSYLASMEKNIADFDATIINDNTRQLFGDFTAKYDKFKTSNTTFADKITSGEFADSHEAYIFQSETLGKASAEVDEAAQKLLDVKLSYYNEQDSANDVLVSETIRYVVIILVVVVALMLVFGFVIASIIAKPMRKLVDVAKEISVGNVDVTLDKPTKDETGMLVAAFTSIVDNTRVQVDAIRRVADGDLTVKIEPRCDKDAINISLKRMLEQNNNVFADIMSSSSQVSTASTAMADGAQALAQGTTEQASAIEQLSQTIAHVAEQTKMNAESATSASDLTATIRQKAEQGDVHMRSMLQAMMDINEASSRISSVIKVIDEIARQTNILALNASVEAARVGQNGKGFAVVAEEVKSLANKSAEAAKNTTEMIESSIRKAEEGTGIAKETSEALASIVQGILEANRLIGEIAASSNNEATAIDQVNIGISQISEVVQVNSATAQQSAAASQQISAQAQLLKELIGQFKLDDGSRPAIVEKSPQKKIPDGKQNAAYMDENGFGKY